MEIAILIITIVNAGLTVALAYRVCERDGRTAAPEREEAKREVKGLEKEVENLMGYDGGSK